MDHVRQHPSLLAAAEKRLLIWIARRLPTRINSDHLTGLALAAMLAAGPVFAAIPRARWAVGAFIALLIVNWFGDSLDGTLARVRNHQRPRYGYYVDHVIDLAGTAALMGGMAVSGMMTPAIGFGLLAIYFMVAAESYLATHSVGVFRIAFAGFGPTELRIVLALGALKVAADPWISVAGQRALLLDVGGLVAAGGLAVAFLANAVRNSAALYRAEPLPEPTPGAPASRTAVIAAAEDACAL